MERKLTDEQILAIGAFVDRYGRRWKTHMRRVWEGGAADFRPEHIPAVRQLRNDFGPSWLKDFKF
jgi:hypothetical protein